MDYESHIAALTRTVEFVGVLALLRAIESVPG